MLAIASRPGLARHAPLDRGRLARTLVTAGAAAAAAGAAWQFVALPVMGRFGGAFEDFGAYAQAVTALAHGHSPYGSFSGDSLVMSGFDYPPFAATLMRPLGALSPQWQATVWLWLALGALVAGAVVVAHTLLPATWPRTRLAVLVALTFPPATYNLWHGQINTVIFLLLALALREWQRGRWTRFAVVVGIAAGIKLVPVVLLVLLLRRSRLRALLAGAATLAATFAVGVAALGTSVTAQWVTGVLPVLSRDNGWVDNNSWNGLANRLLGHSVLTVQPPSPATHVLTILLLLATVGVVLWVSRRRAATPAEHAAQLAVAVGAMVLVGSVDWFPVSVHLLIPLAAAVALAVERRRTGAALWLWSGLLLAALFVEGTVLLGVLDAGSTRAAVTSRWGWLFLQAASLPVLCTAALMVVTARRAGRDSLRGAGSAR